MLPEAGLLDRHALVASSDSAVLELIEQAVDLAGALVRSLGRPLRMIDFTELAK